MKRALSVLLTFAMLLSMFTVFFATSVAAATVITNTSPAIAANVGQTITLSNYSVTFDGDSSATSGVTWKNGSTTITSFTPNAKGVTKLTATKGSKSKTIYVVAKNANESEYVLYEANMSSFASTSDLTSAGWTIPATSSMDSGDLIVSSDSVFLPAWLGEFGDYAFSADVRIKSAQDTTRWFSLIYRADQLANANDYLHLCVRSNTTAENGVEFAEKNANGWNVMKKAAGIHSQMPEKYRTVRVAAFGKTVSNELCGDQVIYVTPDEYTAGVTAAANKGYLGMTMDKGELRVKSVRITLQLSAPVQQKGMIYNDSHNAANLINPIANVQKMNGATDSLANLSVAYYDLTKGINAVEAMTAAMNAKVIPTFYAKTTAQAYEVISAAQITGNEDMTLISNSVEVIDFARMKSNKVRLGLEVDVSAEMKDGVMTDKEADAIRVIARSAPASFIVIGARYADKLAVSELQEMALAVWINIESAAGTDQFARDAMMALTSGANGIISNGATYINSYIDRFFLANTFTRTPITIGHRGNPNVAPENTIEGFQSAYNNGGDVFEIDVQCTSDNVIVVNHDTTLNRTTNYTGSSTIAQMTWAEVQKYHVNALDGSSTGKPIPSLEETLNWARGKDIKIFVEFKNSTSNCIKLTMNKITSLGMTQQVDVISFNRSALAYTQSYSNGMSTGFLLGGSDVKCPDYNSAVDYFASRIEKAHDVKSTINPESYNCQINNFAVQAAADRGMTLWPYTFKSVTTNTAFFDCPDGITTDNMEVMKDMVKLMHGSSFGLEIGEAYDGDKVKTETYGNEFKVIPASELIPYVIAGDSVKVENGKLVGVKDGFSTVMFGYKTKTYAGDEYVVYTQPVSVRVGVIGSVDANGEKVVYIPLDNRPINKDRVEYMAQASGFELVMPEEKLFSNRIDSYNEGVSDQGNPEEIFQWLKTVDDAKYYIISLDQIFSGGLVGSRAPFGDTDDSIASDITDYDWTKGGYTLSDKEQEIIDYLIALSNREDTHVVFFDTVMRLASTGNYMNYRGYDYENFRAYGKIERVQFSGADLTISNIVKNYNKNGSGSTIATVYDPATHGTSQYTEDYQSAPAMVFTDESGVLRALDTAEFKEYFASRERKLVIADALYPNLVNSAARLYIGFDDSNPKITIQSNEGRYITEKLIGDAENCHLFSGADELGMMGLSDIATSIYGQVEISPVYFGGGENLPADEYDTGDLKTNVNVHIESIGGTLNTNGDGELKVLILTRTDGGNGYNSAESTALKASASDLVDAAIRYLNAGIPVAIVDCSNKDGILSNAILASELKNRLGELLGYSQWNTIANSLGTAISNATARYTYLKNSINITEESHMGFMKTVVYAWVKDVSYQQVGGSPNGNEYHFGLYDAKLNLTIDSAEKLVNYINGSDIVTYVQNGTIYTEDNWNATISNFRWPWDRAFEATFDVYAGTYLQYRETVDYESYKVTNITNGKDYTLSLEPSATYPDSGKELTDNVIVSDSDIYSTPYEDSRWVGFTLTKSIREAYITIPLDGTFDIYQFSANIGTDKLGAGITCPNVEFSVSTDGVNFTPVRSEASSTDTTNYAKNIYLAAPFENVRANYVRVKLTSRGKNLLWISEIRVVGTQVPEETCEELPVHTYTTDDSKKWWPDWNNPPCGEGETYDDGVRLIDGKKNSLAFGTGVSGWYPTNNVQMNFNLMQTSMVDEIVATFDKYATYAIPSGCKVEVSTDGVTYTEVSGKFSTVETVPMSNNFASHEIKFKLDEAVKAKNIRITYTTENNSLFLCEEVDFYGTTLKNIVADKAYLTSHGAYDKYTAANYALTDGFVNTYTVYDSTNWLWRDSNTDNLKGSVIFQLDQTYDLTGAATHVEMVAKSGIKAPKDIKLYVSSDGVTYTEIGSFTRPVYSEIQSQKEMLWWEIFQEAKRVNFVKVEYAIESGFILLDEIEIYGTKSIDHDFSADWSSDESGHWHECSCGEIADKAAHDNGEWITVTEADVHKEGLKELRCTVCEFVLDSEKIPEKHDYSDGWSSDESGHWHECSCGEIADKAAHDNGEWITVTEADVHKEGLKELRCTVCDYVLDSEKIPEKHDYSAEWSSDESGHWHECSCGEIADKAAHDNGEWITVTEADVHKEGLKELRCTVCEFVLDSEKIPVEHSYSESWSSDESGHWHECSCGEITDKTAHDDGKWITVTEADVHKEGLKELRCTVCEFVLDSEKIPEKHDYSAEWSSDESGHWHECSCGEITDKTAHDNGEWITVTEADVHKEGLKELRCTVCEFVLDSEKIPVEHSYSESWSSDESGHWHECSCGEKQNFSAHDNGEWITVTEADVHKEGLKELRCTVCEFVLDSEKIPEKHDYSTDWTSDESGHWHECSCGEKQNFSAHDNGEWITVTEADVHKEGLKELRCTVCEFVLDSEKIPVEHSYSESWSSDESGHWHECSCGEKQNFSAHDNGEWITVTEADVHKEGLKELRCTVCEFVLDTEKIPVEHSYSESWSSDESGHWHECSCGEKQNFSAHDNGEWITVTEADVHKEGLKELRCTVCEFVLDSEKIPEKHDYSDGWSSDKDGHWHECSCGETIPKTEHDDVAWVVTEPAGYHKEGEQAFMCKTCGYVFQTAKIDAEHKFDGEWCYDDLGHWQKCECGAEPDSFTAHDNGEWITVTEADVHKEGLKELRCTVCDYVLDSEKIPEKHDYSDGWSSDKDGHWHECACGETTDKTAHDNGEWIVVKKADVHEEGLKELRCTVCGYVLDSEKIPEKHDYSESWTSDESGHWHECSCGEISDKAAHDNGEWIVVKEADIHEEGLKELRCTVCEFVLDSEKIPEKHDYSESWSSDESGHWHECSCGEIADKAAHDNGEWITVTEADVHKEGLKELRCTVCEFVLDSEKIPEKHDYSTDWSSDESGHWHECSCGEIADKAAHDNGEWIVVKEATADEEGLKELRCTCGYVLDSEVIPVVSTGMLGDINDNGKIDSMDYVLLKRAYFGTYKIPDEIFWRGDINGNGKIDSMDYVLLKRAYFGTYKLV